MSVLLVCAEKCTDMHTHGLAVLGKVMANQVTKREPDSTNGTVGRAGWGTSVLEAWVLIVDRRGLVEGKR